MVAQTVKTPHTCSVGNLGLIPGLGRSPGGGHGNPLQNSCLENPHGQRSLAGYIPWGLRESDTIEWLSTHIHVHIKFTFNLTIDMVGFKPTIDILWFVFSLAPCTFQNFSLFPFPAFFWVMWLFFFLFDINILMTFWLYLYV